MRFTSCFFPSTVIVLNQLVESPIHKRPKRSCCAVGVLLFVSTKTDNKQLSTINLVTIVLLLFLLFSVCYCQQPTKQLLNRHRRNWLFLFLFLFVDSAHQPSNLVWLFLFVVFVVSNHQHHLLCCLFVHGHRECPGINHKAPLCGLL